MLRYDSFKKGEGEPTPSSLEGVGAGSAQTTLDLWRRDDATVLGQGGVGASLAAIEHERARAVLGDTSLHRRVEQRGASFDFDRRLVRTGRDETDFEFPSHDQWLLPVFGLVKEIMAKK